MKTGIFTWFGFILSFEEKMRLLKEYGFESTCLWFGNEFAEIDGDYLTQNERAQRFGIAVESAHIPYYGANSLWFDTLDGESYFQKCMDNLAQAQRCGVDTLVIHPFERDAPRVADGLCRERFHRLPLQKRKTLRGSGPVPFS